MTVVVQTDGFDAGRLLDVLHGQNPGVGAVVSFVGYVRDFNVAHAVHELFLEHYPGMTEKSLAAIEAEARQRWPLLAVSIVHRVGQLAPSAPVVFVGVASAYRQAAFDACAFIMDYLKTRAPFWKKELGGQGSQWVAARDSDQQAAQRWAR
ncbi:molybdopterin synthase catalytic subunit MoaE [Pseudomonas cavernicola]|uniref:Molybdopterin synthase catalytic subunit n=1 Tax=Pseudomonas cavernicola TaxID=2320866 RepID=A0A418X8U3_9PSED|nr:molybdopterin synthase catalytic subunit MoaE [Pseudomonas cavernicola]RJG08894.1 molybdopterin synthase catalytic subunit MoaE [Pseudomonas cavernicola]